MTNRATPAAANPATICTAQYQAMSIRLSLPRIIAASDTAGL
jgi:hypothetical protein